MTTTLNKIKEHDPCIDGWKKLLKSLNKTKADDEPITIQYIIESNGLDDAIWALRAVDGKDKEIRLFAVWCFRQVQHLIIFQRSINALDTVERYINDEATIDELMPKWDDIANEVWNAPIGAIYDVAQSSAQNAAWNKRGDASYGAVFNSARDAQKQELIRICKETE